MLLRKFRENGPDVIFMILVIALFTWSGNLIHPVLSGSAVQNNLPMPFFGILTKITGISPFVSTFSAFLIVILISYLLVSFNTSVFFISERTFLPALLYILFTGLVPQIQIMNPVLPAAPFLILGIRKIMDSYQVQGTAYSFFDAGILIGTGSLFYAGMIWFGILLIVGIAVLRPVGLRELFLSIAGLMTPIFIFTGFYYVLGYDISHLGSAITYNMFGRLPEIPAPVKTIVVLLVAGMLVLISLSHLFRALREKRIKSRKTFTLLFWVFFISTGMYFIFSSVSLEIYWLTAIPLTYFLCHYFVFSRNRRITEIMFIILLVLVAVIQVLNISGKYH
jgi:hypothetical protein